MPEGRGFPRIPMITFFVPGVPQPGGSKKGFFNKKTARVQVSEANSKCAPWRAVVSQAAMEAVNGAGLLDGPLRMKLEFVVVRPKGHYGSKGLRPAAPAFPTVRPDASKLARAAEDALTGIIWRDDSQVVTQLVTKRYGEQAGVTVTIVEEKV
jgi:Holliday junction resolvase RusA-like endonuclease